MTRVTVALAAGVFAFASATPAASRLQSVDDIVQKNLEAKGGLARLKAVQTMKQAGKLSIQGNDASVTLYSKRPNLVRQETTVGGVMVVTGFDGVTPWILNPNVSARAILVTGQQADKIREQSGFDGPLVDYKSQGTMVAMNGFEMMGNRRVIHLRLTSATEQRSDLYLDAETYLDAKLSSTPNQGQLRLDQELGDYRDVQGLKVPFLIRTLTNGVLQSELKLQSVEFNVTIDEALFRVPRI